MKFKRKDNTILTPTKGHSTDAGLDIYAPFDYQVAPHSFSDRINLGVAFEIPFGYVGIISERSSQGKKGIHTVGNIVDYGYTGFVHVTLVNDNDVPYEIIKGDRICQMIVVACDMSNLEEVSEFEVTERGDNSHGSTGI